MGKDLQIGRLAFRQEGGYWNGYYAKKETMDDAIFLGSIKMNIIMGNTDRRGIFKGLMQEAVSDLIEEATGVRPSWGGEKPAPEHERSGNA